MLPIHSVLFAGRANASDSISSQHSSSVLGKKRFSSSSLARSSMALGLLCMMYGCFKILSTAVRVNLSCRLSYPRVCNSTSNFTRLNTGVCEMGNPIVTLRCFKSLPLTFGGRVCSTDSSIVSSQSTMAVSISFSPKFPFSHCGM